MNNPVAKHQHLVNRAVVMKDRKKAGKKGYCKHKKSLHSFAA